LLPAIYLVEHSASGTTIAIGNMRDQRGNISFYLFVSAQAAIARLLGASNNDVLLQNALESLLAKFYTTKTRFVAHLVAQLGDYVLAKQFLYCCL
jgi:hypothetical protein